MLILNHAIMIRPNPLFSEWVIGVVKEIGLETLCEYYDDEKQRQPFSFFTDGWQEDNQVYVQGYSTWKNSQIPQVIE